MTTSKIKSTVGFLIPTLKSGGAERVVSILSNALANDYQVIIFTFYESKPFYTLGEKVKVVVCQDSIMQSKNMIHSVANHFKLIRKIIKQVRANEIDIIIGFMTTASIYTVITSKILKIPSIISERVHPDYSSIGKVWFRLRKFLYPKADTLVVQTESIKNYFSPFVKEQRLKIINNPIAPDLVSKKENLERNNVVLNVGRLDHQKNQDLLIRAFHQINNEKWKLLIIGEGNNRSKYQDLIDSLNLNDDVKLLGNITDMPKYYNTSKIFVSTSRFEGSPNALIEALYYGLSCISTDCPSGPSELIINDVNGFLVPVEGEEELIVKLSELMKNASLRRRLSENTQVNSNHFNIDHIKLHWIEIIDNLLDTSKTI